jgi:hypothetical protein
LIASDRFRDCSDRASRAGDFRTLRAHEHDMDFDTTPRDARSNHPSVFATSEYGRWTGKLIESAPFSSCLIAPSGEVPDFPLVDATLEDLFLPRVDVVLLVISN